MVPMKASVSKPRSRIALNK